MDMSGNTAHSGAPQQIVFFDGHCNLCNSSIDLLIQIDRKQILKFAPLSGTTAKQLHIESCDEAGPQNQSVIFYRDSQNIFKRSDAALEICIDLFQFNILFKMLKLIPRFIRDGLYQFVARYRYQIFGRRDTCRMPTAELEKRFLD